MHTAVSASRPELAGKGHAFTRVCSRLRQPCGNLNAFECIRQQSGLSATLLPTPPRPTNPQCSFVRSLTMDSWKPREVAAMTRGGNQRFVDAFNAAGLPVRLGLRAILVMFAGHATRLTAPELPVASGRVEVRDWCRH